MELSAPFRAVRGFPVSVQKFTQRWSVSRPTSKRGAARPDRAACQRRRRHHWRRRWLASTGNRVAERLADAPRPGTPAPYSAEDACAICEGPCDSGRAITHWTQREPAAEAIKRGIVPGISQRSVGRILIKMSTSNPIVCAGGSTPSPIRSSPRTAMTFARPIGSPPRVPPLVSQPSTSTR